MMIYAGIGARKTPANVKALMFDIGKKLALEGYTLRSGGAAGADTAFWNGAISMHGKTQIFKAIDATEDAIAIAKQFHPAWHRCSQITKQLHGRNALILLGKDLQTPVKFVVCWTKDAKTVGGTGMGIAIANAFNIPVRNLADKNVLEYCYRWMER